MTFFKSFKINYFLPVFSISIFPLNAINCRNVCPAIIFFFNIASLEFIFVEVPTNSSTLLYDRSNSKPFSNKHTSVLFNSMHFGSTYKKFKTKF